MSKPITLTAQQQKALLDFHASSTLGKTMQLNPADASHQSYINTLLTAAGRTAKAFPHLFGAAGKAAPAGSGQDTVRMLDAGKGASGNATARIVALSKGASVVTGGSLLVLDSETGKLLASGNNSDVQNGFLNCATQPETAAPVAGGKKLSVLYLGHTTDESGNTRLYSYADTAMATDTAIQCTVTAPASATNDPIQIAVGRTTANPPPAGTDYIYYESANEPGTSAYLIAPFVGSVALAGSIDLPGLTAADVSSSIFVTYTSGPPVESTLDAAFTTPAKVVAAFSVGSAPNILQWNFPYDGPNNGYTTTNSIVYQNNASLNSQLYSCFLFSFNSIPLQGGAVAPPFYVCSMNTPGEPSLNCTQIKNLTYYYHCLAKGTLVTLEDGSTMPIEKVTERVRVKTGVDGKGLAVYATVLGRHASDPAKGSNEIRRVTTANGKSIVVTESHMLYMSADKSRMVMHLAVGDSIITDEGASTIKSIEAIAYDDMFYGLEIGSSEEKKQKGFPANNVGFYAGGILCADEQTMRVHSRADFQDLEYMLPRINAALKHDYTSALQHKRY
ncbi:MAG: hypothetical protein JWP12_2881 [Bacteroidetes bacterium]|nr:hypothetical protein [Bacteroidota bacterium]